MEGRPRKRCRYDNQSPGQHLHFSEESFGAIVAVSNLQAPDPPFGIPAEDIAGLERGKMWDSCDIYLVPDIMTSSRPSTL